MKQIWLCKLVIALILLSANLSAQVDSAWQQNYTLGVSAFADIFYVYDFNQPESANRQPFLFNHNRHNEFNLNLGFVKLKVGHPKYRANFALQTGTYANDNYAAEPGLLKNIFEANIGISLNKNNTLWLDTGVLPSHIGFESAISMDNMTLTRSLFAENSPYFLTGAKLTFTPNEKWIFSGLIVNGWQRIQRLEGNSMPSFGTQINYSPSEKILVNWSTFIGTDDPDITRRMRYFNNLYGQFQVSQKFDFIAGFDFGLQQAIKGSPNYDSWFSPVLIGQYHINGKLDVAARIEYYQDKTGIIISTETQNGFQTTGFSFNIDYSPHQNILCRLEARWLNSLEPIFETNAAPTRNNYFVGTSLAIKFPEFKTKQLTITE